MHSALRPRALFDLDEARACAYEGLLRAMSSFDPRRGLPFERYAKLRVRGAILDGLRASTSFGRAGLAQLRALERAYQAQRLEEALPAGEGEGEGEGDGDGEGDGAREGGGGEPGPLRSPPEALGDLWGSFKTLRALATSVALELLTPPSDPEEALLDALEQERERARLSAAFERLSAEERELLSAVYDLRGHGESASSYAEAQGIGRAAVSKRHAKALRRLRALALMGPEALGSLDATPPSDPPDGPDGPDAPDAPDAPGASCQVIAGGGARARGEGALSRAALSLGRAALDRLLRALRALDQGLLALLEVVEDIREGAPLREAALIRWG